jgi:hypothetical protein
MTASCRTNDLILIRARSVVLAHPDPPSISRLTHFPSEPLTLPSIRVCESGFRNFWTIRATGTIAKTPMIALEAESD